MPKLSVSVSDELWAASIDRAGGGAGPSQVVQTALRAFVEDQPRLAVAAEVTDDDRALVADAVSALAGDYLAEYRRGFRDGAKVAKLCGFDLLATWALDQFDPTEGEGFEFPDNLTEENDQRWINGVFDESQYAGTYADGVANGLRAVWEGLKEAARTGTLQPPSGQVHR